MKPPFATPPDVRLPHHLSNVGWLATIAAVLVFGVGCNSARIAGVADGGGLAGAAGNGASDAMAPPPADDARIIIPDASVSDGPGVGDAAREFKCGDGALGNAGCSFYGVASPLFDARKGGCYAMFVVNPGDKPARIKLAHRKASQSLARIARVPRGSGQNITYESFDEAAGLPPGGLVVIFLTGKYIKPAAVPQTSPDVSCPEGIESLLPDAVVDHFTHRGMAFHLTSDEPVVAYDINPFGMATSYTPSASLLIPEEAWARSAIVPTPPRTYNPAQVNVSHPWRSTDATYVTIVAAHDNTAVSLRPRGAVLGDGDLPAAAALQTVKFFLNAGEYAHLLEGRSFGDRFGLGGTILSANQPVLAIGGTPCSFIFHQSAACDTSYQQIPPPSAWGNEYAAVSYRSRTIGPEPVPWTIVGAVDGTTLTYEPQTPALHPAAPTAPPPTRLHAGEVVQFWTADPFVVKSQGTSHPFYLAAQMSGGAFMREQRTPENIDAGDPDFVNVTPPAQFLNDYTFFTDPTYSETNLVVVRKRGADGKYADVKLDCAAAPITQWTDVGGFQFSRVDLVTGNFVATIPGCNNGVNRISSAAPFGLTVWGWGTRLAPRKAGEVNLDLTHASYGYPAGAGLKVVNTVPEIIVP
jgi:hypothetical protein